MIKKMILIIIICSILAYVSGILTVVIRQNQKKQELQDSIIYSITIDVETINLRPEIDLDSEIIRKVYKGEVFSVVEYHEGGLYNWYRIIYEDGKAGWVASGKTDPWVHINKECE